MGKLTRLAAFFATLCAVHAALAEELAGPMHALSLELRAIEE